LEKAKLAKTKIGKGQTKRDNLDRSWKRPQKKGKTI